MPAAGAVEDAVAALRAHLPTQQVLTGAAAVPLSWNLALTARPALRVRCTDEGDVQRAVRAARDHGLPLSVLGRGYDWAGRGVLDGGLVVDVSDLRSIDVNPLTRTCTVGGGTSSLELATAVEPHGLAPVTGWLGGAGIVGLALGGGYGPLCGRAGRAADNLLAARVVLADGSVVTTDDDPDLLWALRGGGGNFGVVVSARFALHPVPLLVRGTMTFPWSRARTVLRRLGDLVRAAPDELTVRIGLVADGEGQKTLLVSPVWSGAAADWMDSPGPVPELRTLGEPMTDDVGPGTLTSLLAEGDEGAPHGQHVVVATRTLSGLHDASVDALVAAGESITSPLSRVWVHHFHGVAARTSTGSSALEGRTPHLVTEVVAAWDGTGSAVPHRFWAERTSARLSWSSTPAGTVNLLTTAAPDQVRAAYGPQADRLLELKRRYDPDGVFVATPLPAGDDPGARLEATRDRG